MIIAAAISIVKLIVFREARERFIYLGQYIRKIILTRAVGDYKVDKGNKRALIRIAVPAFISLLLMYSGVYA
jgi:hypothetical protein